MIRSANLISTIRQGCRSLLRAGRRLFGMSDLPDAGDSLARLLCRGDVYVEGSERLAIGEQTNVGTGAVMIAEPGTPEQSEGGSIELGRNVYVGRRVQLAANAGMKLSIGEDTSIQDNSIILGDVRIERHCLIAFNVYASSGQHLFDEQPTWLIRDQDALRRRGSLRSRPIHVEEDCWIGYGVVIMPGVYIGRGAVVGANTVVTGDVPPYSVQAGSPNREIRRRFDFDPPASLDALNENHHPYFYAGFCVRQAEIAAARPQGVLGATSSVRLIVRGGSFDRMTLAGHLNDDVAGVALRVRCNGADAGRVEIRDQQFKTQVELSREALAKAEDWRLSGVMEQHNLFELAVESCEPASLVAAQTHDSLYGISSFSIE